MGFRVQAEVTEASGFLTPACQQEMTMDLSTLRAYLNAKPGAVEEFPFDLVTLVVKVAGRMFALVATGETPLRLNLKCDPLKAEVLREYYSAVLPGYHMNKRHWNTLVLDGSIPDDDLLAMIDESYALVLRGLPKGKRPA
jgi:predicted DNA-binding protein (MmcQ/YjbR family)